MQEQKGDYITILSTNNKSVMLQIFTLQKKNKSIILHFLREKQKYRITSRSSKLSLKRFLAAFVILIEESFYLIARKGKLIIMFERRTKGRVHYNTFNE